MKNYLTEEKLGVILQSIFRDITPQYKYNRRRVDFAVRLSAESNQYSSFNNKFKESNTKDIMLFYEFDGFHHYQNSYMIEKDGPRLVWQVLDSENKILQLRIPYWVQPVAELSKVWFETYQDFSEGFPQGFISKECVCPSTFCTDGETEFIRELAVLPLEIKKQIHNNLLDRVIETGRARTISRSLHQYLTLTNY
jgi:hypothetical protein